MLSTASTPKQFLVYGAFCLQFEGTPSTPLTNFVVGRLRGRLVVVMFGINLLCTSSPAVGSSSLSAVAHFIPARSMSLCAAVEPTQPDTFTRLAPSSHVYIFRLGALRRFVHHQSFTDCQSCPKSLSIHVHVSFLPYTAYKMLCLACTCHS